MTFVYIALVAVFGFLCYYVGKRLERANNDVERLSDIYRADDIINRSSSDFDRMYAKKHKRKSNL